MNQPSPPATGSGRTIPWLIASVVFLLAAGCSSGDVDRGSATSTTSPVRGVAESTTPWPDQVRPPSYGPIDPRKALDRLDELVGNTTSKLLARRNELAYSCLSERGFRFTRSAPEALQPDDPRPITQRAFATTWGFGITTAFTGGGRELFAVNPHQPLPVDSLDGRGVPTVPEVVAEGDDPATTDRANAALNTDVDATASCASRANEQLHLTSSGPFTAAAELRRLVLEQFDNSADLRKLAATYGSCMAEAGFAGLASPTAAFGAIKDAFTALSDSYLGAVGGPEAIDPGGADAATTDRFDQLNQRELALARANLDCEGAFTPPALRLVDRIQRSTLRDNRPLVAAIQKGE